MKAVVRPIPFPQSGRLLAVSDVHGNLPWLKGLLDKVGFTPDDALVLDAVLLRFPGRLLVDSLCEIERDLLEDIALHFGAILF